MIYRKIGKTGITGILAVSLALSLFFVSGCGHSGDDGSKEENDFANVLEEVESLPLVAASVSLDKYTYQTLDEEEQSVYDELYYAITNRAENVVVATLDEDKMEHAYQAVLNDYCDLFYLDHIDYVTYTLDDEPTSIEVTPVFSMTEEEQESYKTQIEEEADRMLADAPWDGNDFEKALYVYETLIREVDYVEDSENNQNIISAFINHETVCQGYSYATQYLLEKLGIPCTTVIGTVESGAEDHSWNLVILDGEYYYIDTTWGNSEYTYRDEETPEAIEEAEEEDGYEYVDYDYFAVTTESLTETHLPDPEFPMPECTATQDNYYVHKGLYMDTWDSDQAGTILGEAYDAGNPVAQIKFADEELYNEAFSWLLDDGHIFDYCDGLDYVEYLENDGSNVLIIMY